LLFSVDNFLAGGAINKIVRVVAAENGLTVALVPAPARHPRPEPWSRV
jgi:hypothetical protein